jgi:putative glycosyltransferase
MKLSIVSTLYHSSDSINEFYRRVCASARQLVEEDFEVVFVNDGSPDNSLNLAINLTKQFSNVVVVDLSRNFGHHKAMMTGLAHSQGERVFLIDVDLEEDPSWLLTFSEQMERDSCDVVYGQQEHRKGDWFERVSGEWFYRFFKSISGLNLSENFVTSRLMTRRYVDALLTHKEREVFLAGLWLITGFDQRAQIIKKVSTSVTTYTFRRKVSLLVNAVTAFSNAPLIIIFYVGTLIFLFALTYIAYLVAIWLIIASPISGWTSVMASIWLLGGMIISFLGIIGIYLSKIFSETKKRPYTIVRQVYKSQ